MAKAKPKIVPLKIKSEEMFYRIFLRLFHILLGLTQKEEDILVHMLLLAKDGVVSLEIKKKIQFDLKIVNLAAYIKTLKDKKVLKKVNGVYQISPHIRQPYGELSGLHFNFSYEKETDGKA